MIWESVLLSLAFAKPLNALAIPRDSQSIGVPLITLEEHFVSEAVGASIGYQRTFSAFPPSFRSKLYDLDDERLADMDQGQITMQVLSHGPANWATPDQCRAANDRLAEAVAAHPTRFAGFAFLPISQPSEAVTEFRRCIQELGFVGALIDNHAANGEYYDNPKYWPLFEAAQEMDVPIYLHPTFPTQNMTAMLYQGNYPNSTQLVLGTAGIGWHADTALHVLRLFGAGVFDHYPKLKIVIGHDGELLPFTLNRTAGFMQHLPNIQRNLIQVWDENIWVTTSGMFSLPPFECLLQTTRMDHIMYSVDYPFSDNLSGLRFMQDVRASGLLTEEQFEMLAYKNAETLLRVRVCRDGLAT